MSYHTPLRRWMIPIWLLAAAVCAVAQQAVPLTQRHDPALIQQYEQQWLDREKAARTPETRIALARDLHEAAANANDPKRKLLLLDMTWAWGSQDCPGGYYYAASAVQHIRRLDKTRRVECLERLAFLFRQAWDRDRQKFLGNGMELANVKMLTADQRLMNLIAQRQAGDLSKSQFISGLSQCKREYAEASNVTRMVMATAKRYAESHSNPQARQALGAFVTEHEPLVERIEGGRDELQSFAVEYVQQGDAVLPAVQTAAAVASREQPAESQAQPPSNQSETSAPPEPDPAPKPAPDASPDPPAVASSEPNRSKPSTGRSGSAFRQLECEKCGDPFVPEFGSDATVCYWCKNELGFFRVDEK